MFPRAVPVLFAVIALLACGPVRAAGTFESECVFQLAKAEIHVTVDASRVVYDYTRSTHQLTATEKHGADGAVAEQKAGEWTTLGLTVVNKSYRIDPSGSLLKQSDGQGCLRPSFAVSIQMNPQTVYVGREFAAGSCAFREIMAHEMRHVTANQQHAEGVARSLEALMRTSFGNDIYYGKADTLQKDLTRVVKTGWMPYLTAELKKVKSLHEQIDSRAEYARMGTMCNGEVPKVLGSGRGV